MAEPILIPTINKLRYSQRYGRPALLRDSYIVVRRSAHLSSWQPFAFILLGSTFHGSNHRRGVAGPVHRRLQVGSVYSRSRASPTVADSANRKLSRNGLVADDSSAQSSRPLGCRPRSNASSWSLTRTGSARPQIPGGRPIRLVGEDTLPMFYWRLEERNR
jgi:hypothetical protein